MIGVRARSTEDGRFIRTDPVRRFYAHVIPAPNGCWEWVGRRDPKGYGAFVLDGKDKRAHRVAWTFAGNEVPAGFELDHLCRNRRCVNPSHLEPVTHQENMARSELARRQTCANGHPWSPENTARRTSGARRCRKCMRTYRARHLGARRTA